MTARLVLVFVPSLFSALLINPPPNPQAADALDLPYHASEDRVDAYRTLERRASRPHVSFFPLFMSQNLTCV